MSWRELSENIGKSIPSLLLRQKEQQPFVQCSDCKGPVGDPDSAHYVFKSYSRLSLELEPTQVIEIALCENCLTRLGSQISEESAKKLKEFKERHPNIGAEVMIISDGGFEERPPTCAVTDKTIDELKEYHLNGLIVGDKLIGPVNVIGDEGITAYEECLSPETKGLEDDLLDRILDLPPEIEDLIKDRSPILL